MPIDMETYNSQRSNVPYTKVISTATVALCHNRPLTSGGWMARRGHWISPPQSQHQWLPYSPCQRRCGKIWHNRNTSYMTGQLVTLNTCKTEVT